MASSEDREECAQKSLLETYRTAPLGFPLHVVDEGGDALCGGLASDQEERIEQHGTEILPTVEEKRDGEPWKSFVIHMCGNCRSSLLAQTDHEPLHEGYEQYQEATATDHRAAQDVANARALLSDFEDESTEVRHGSIKHAISELENAKRRLPDEY